jgi:hypothetical protein
MPISPSQGEDKKPALRQPIHCCLPASWPHLLRVIRLVSDCGVENLLTAVAPCWNGSARGPLLGPTLPNERRDRSACRGYTGHAVKVTATAALDPDSAVRFSRASRQIDRHQRTFATTIKSSHSGRFCRTSDRFRLFGFWKKSPMGGSRSSRPVPMGVVSGPQVSTVAVLRPNAQARLLARREPSAASELVAAGSRSPTPVPADGRWCPVGLRSGAR